VQPFPIFPPSPEKAVVCPLRTIVYGVSFPEFWRGRSLLKSLFWSLRKAVGVMPWCWVCSSKGNIVVVPRPFSLRLPFIDQFLHAASCTQPRLAVRAHSDTSSGSGLGGGRDPRRDTKAFNVHRNRRLLWLVPRSELLPTHVN